MIILHTYEHLDSERHIYRYNNKIYSLNSKKVYTGLIAKSSKEFNGFINRYYSKVNK